MKYDLTEFGLDEAEAAVYSAFLEIGTATVSEVTKAAGITRTLGYHVIDKLIKKGLVDGVLSESKKLYRANHPRSLSNYVKKREKEWQRKSEKMDDILSELVNAYKYDKKPVIRYQEGVQGVIKMYEEKLHAKTEIYSVQDVESWKTPEFWDWANAYHKRRTRKGVQERILLLDTPAGRSLVENYKGIPQATTYRWVSKEHAKSLLQFGGAVDAYDDNVMISLIDQPRKMGIIIENSVLANIIRALFELAWDRAEPAVFKKK